MVNGTKEISKSNKIGRMVVGLKKMVLIVMGEEKVVHNGGRGDGCHVFF